MSLINDALKRAKESQQPHHPSSAASLRTIEARPAERPYVSRMLLIVILLLLGSAFAFIGMAMTGRLAKKNLVLPQVAAVRPIAAVFAPSQPVKTAVPVVAVAPVAPVVPVQTAPAPVPVSVVVAPVVVAPALPPLVLPDTLHVQGVAYDPVRPWAIVSSRTVYVGDVVKGVRVMEITRNSVTFGSNGQTNRLFVGE